MGVDKDIKDRHQGGRFGAVSLSLGRVSWIDTEGLSNALNGNYAKIDPKEGSSVLEQ